MRVCVLGAGYVGLVTGAGLASLGHDICCLDVDSAKIARLNSGDVPLFEPGLPELVNTGVEAGRLRFSSDAAQAIGHADIVMIAVGTPGGPDGRADLRALRAAAKQVAEAAKSDLLIIIKSTVPISTGEQIEELVRSTNSAHKFDVVSNPEFLREGAAIEDFMRPDRVVLGVESERAEKLLRELYRPLNLIEAPIIARVSASFSWSMDSTVAITWISQR